MFLHGLLNGFAVAAAIVATLRAGSRALFISQNGAIGLVDGPTIAPPHETTNPAASNSSSSSSNISSSSGSSSRYNPALYEISENFKHCVRIASSLPTGSYKHLAHDRPVVVDSEPSADDDSKTQKQKQQKGTTDGVVARFLGAKVRLAEVLETDQKQRQLKERIQRRKDPFAGGSSGGSGGYTLGYAPYEPKTFSALSSGNANSDKDDGDDDDDDNGRDGTLGSEAAVAEADSGTATVPETTTNRAALLWKTTRSSVSSGLGRLPSIQLPRRLLFRWKTSKDRELWDDDDESNEDSDSVLDSAGASMWDYGRATEADWFYNVRTSPTTHRRRLAQLTAYCPKVFGHLRKSVFGIPEENYLASILSSPLVSFQSNSKGAARAGGVFLFTSDGAYLIKTIPEREKKTFLAMLPGYHKHMRRYGKSSLLTRFCGMYGITIQEEDRDDAAPAADADAVEGSSGPTLSAGSSGDGNGDGDDTGASALESFAPARKEYTFVVMNAVFPAESDKFISERFDLKGSTVGREVSLEELKKKGSMAVLKDLDLQREVDLVRSKQRQQRLRMITAATQSQKSRTPRWKTTTTTTKTHRANLDDDRTGFTIGATAKAALLAQLRKDVEFLTECQVMDYSLLVGVVYRDSLLGTTTSSSNEKRLLTREMVQSLRKQDRVLQQLEGPAPTASSSSSSSSSANRNLPKLDADLVHTLSTPFRLLASPPFYVAKSSWNILRRTLDSIVTAPLPYYGSGHCGVDGGILSVLHGERNGHRAIYYLGLIDFLQPWTTRKVLERTVKGLMGHDKDAISAVTPEEYAARFLKFLDEHIH